MDNEENIDEVEQLHGWDDYFAEVFEAEIEDYLGGY